MLIDNIGIVYLTCEFILPGYIIREILSAIVPHKRVSDSARVVEVLGYSILYIALWNWLLILIAYYISPNSVWYAAVLTIVVIITAGVTGTVFGIVYAKDLHRKLFQLFGINITHPVPTAWDYKFSTCPAQWVEVFLSNGKTLRGQYSSNSFSSSDESFRDIYLEELYVFDNTTGNEWIRVNRTAGVWIHPNEIRYIKFYTLEDIINEQQI